MDSSLLSISCSETREFLLWQEIRRPQKQALQPSCLERVMHLASSVVDSWP